MPNFLPSSAASSGGDPGCRRVLVTGATGYIGSRLIPLLLERGHEVIAASRHTSSTGDYPWGAQVETREFDVEDEDLIASAVQGVDAVIYLVHSMESKDFVAKDCAAAERTATACQRAGVERIVYLSGLVPPGQLSEHLRSRHEVEQVFLDGPVPAMVLRAAMVIGAGSTSFELLRRLSQRVPLVTPMPTWMRSKVQPVAIEDVADLIERSLRGKPRNTHVDVGGEEVLTYPELLERFARIDGLRRRRVLVPWVPEWVVGGICALISGLPRVEVTALIRSLRHDMICREDSLRGELIDGDFTFTGVDESLRRSLTPQQRPGTARRGDPLAAARTDPA